MDSGGMMLSGPRDFSRGGNGGLPGINNNEVLGKDQQTSVAAANFMSHLLKVRQEMALNMSKDSDSDRHTDSPTHHTDSPTHHSDDTDNEKEEPINLHNSSEGRQSAAGSDPDHSPASPSSDTGNSTGSAKEQKASRLENIVGGLARTGSSPLPTQGCKKRKLYQPI